MGDWLPAVFGLLLGGGGIAFITTIGKGIGSLRGGARAREREAVNDLGKDRERERELRIQSERDTNYWRTMAYTYIGQLLRAGVEPVPKDPVAPSERDGRVWPRPGGGARHALQDDSEDEREG